jgi:hypothetical protein
MTRQEQRAKKIALKNSKRHVFRANRSLAARELVPGKKVAKQAISAGSLYSSREAKNSKKLS